MTDDEALHENPAEQEILLRLAALPQEAEPARDLWPGIAARLAPEVPAIVPAPPRRRSRFLIQAAAAVLLFAGGVAVGRQWESHPARPVRDALAPAVEVQRTGTEYVAALRFLAERPDSPATQAQGREAALSVLYGAAHELVRLSPNDAGVTQILNSVSVTRSGGRGRNPDRPFLISQEEKPVKRRTIAAIAAIALILIAAGSPAAYSDGTAIAKTSGRCPEGHPETGDLGIESLLCVSGSCAVNMRTDSGYTHMFSTEPRIRGLVDGSPAAGKLMDGDVLIAIDGVLITTREGGRRLANLKPGDPVTLRIRRDRREMDVILVPRLGCNMPGLAVLMGSPTPRPAVAPRPAPELPPGPIPQPALAPRPTPSAEPAPRPIKAPRAETPATAPRPAAAPEARPEARPEKPPFTFGLELECGSCGWRSGPGGALRWFSPALPTIRSVEPGGPGAQAGLQPGDVLVEIDGHSLSNEEAGREIGKLRPGHAVQVRFRRDREEKTVSITPRGEMPPAQPF